MNKSQLATELAVKTGIPQPEAQRILNATLELIALALAQGEKVQLMGFGTFDVKEREARQSHHPATGEPMEIPAARIPQFKPSAQLKELVDQ